VKIKLNKLPSLLLFLVSFIGIVYLLYFFFSPELISPKSSYSLDLISKLTTKISKLQKLNYSKSETLPSLNNIPRYLSYNQETGRVYAAKNRQESFSPASFTKLLTTQVALDLIDSNQHITATRTSVNKVPTILGLKPGEQLTVKDLVRASIATSANDAAQTLAEGVASLYGEPTSLFIDLMNKKAKQLDMTNSRFTNPDGLDDQKQYSNLEDMAKLIHNVQQNYPEILESAISDNQDIDKTELHDHYYLPNWNGLLGVYPGATGLKIAYTENAGYSTIVTATREGISVVVILSGADSFIERDLAATALLDQAFVVENIVPAKITSSKIKARYQIWANLATKIRQESN
jgi:D-alanyl-D-alanine carboxypeptidase